MRTCMKILKFSTRNGIYPNLKETASHSQEVSSDWDAGKPPLHDGMLSY